MRRGAAVLDRVGGLVARDARVAVTQGLGKGAVALEGNGKANNERSEERMAALEAKGRRKDEVLGELMEE